MGCVSSKEKEGEKYEKKTEDDEPAEDETSTKEEEKAKPEDDEAANSDSKATTPKKAKDDKPTHYIKQFYDNIDPHFDDTDGDFIINRPKIDDTADDDSVRALIRVKHDDKDTPSYLSKTDQAEFTPFTAEQKKEVTDFLNAIENLADEQGIFGALGRK